MAFDIEMIEKVYKNIPSRVDRARELVGRPLTLTEKILYAHLWEKIPTGHSLKDESQFIDCVYRASYLSKQDDKDNVQYKKKFGTTTG
jgi:hypothetical protein